MTTYQETATLPKGEELLNGLYIVKSYMDRYVDKAVEFTSREAKYLDKRQRSFNTETVSGKSEYSLFVTGLSVSIAAGLASLLGGDILALIVVFVIVALFFLGKVRGNSKLLKYATMLLAFICIKFVLGQLSFALTSHNFGSLIICIAFLGIAAFIGQFILKRQRAKMRELYFQCKIASDECKSIVNEMLDETASWFPNDYYIPDAVDKFLKIVINHEADTIKEMVSTYKTDKYRSEVITSLEGINNKLNTVISNQQETKKLLYIGNALQAVNVFANMSTAESAASTASSMDAMARKFGAK